MKIVFGLSKDIMPHIEGKLLKYNWTAYKSDDSDHKYNCSESQIRVKKLLKEQFESVIIYQRRKGNQSFEFDDPADEAAFLIWSNRDYVEI